MTEPKHARTEAIRYGPRVSGDPGDETQDLTRFLLPGAESTSARLRNAEADRDLADAELASARQEIALLRGELGGMRDHRDLLSRDLDETRRELEAAHAAADRAHQRVVALAAELNTERGRTAVGDRAAPAVAVADAWMCVRTVGGCARRYREDDPQHYCGRLTPVRITITHRTEGTPTE